MVKEVVLHQAEIEALEHKYTVTHIPTATSGCWYVIHDAFEVWAAVAIDLNGEVVGWRNPPVKEDVKTAIEKAIKETFELTVPS